MIYTLYIICIKCSLFRKQAAPPIKLLPFMLHFLSQLAAFSLKSCSCRSRSKRFCLSVPQRISFWRYCGLKNLLSAKKKTKTVVFLFKNFKRGQKTGFEYLNKKQRRKTLMDDSWITASCQWIPCLSSVSSTFTGTGDGDVAGLAFLRRLMKASSGPGTEGIGCGLFRSSFKTSSWQWGFKKCS